MEHLKVLILCTCTLMLYSHHAQARVNDPTVGSADAGIGGPFTEIDALLPTVLLAGTETPQLVEVSIEYGDSLEAIARWANTEVSIVESLNGIDESEAIDAGHPLLLPMTASEASAFKAARARASELRNDRYIRKRGGLAGFKQHEMVRGETVWGIARRHGKLPLWLIQSLNPELDLNRVKVGAIVILPLLGDEAPAATQATETNEDGHDDEGTRSMNEDGYEYDDDEEGC